MNGTWDWLVAAAAWCFLAGMLLVAASAFPAVARRRPRLMLDGFLLTVASLALVFLAWGLPRVL